MRAGGVKIGGCLLVVGWAVVWAAQAPGPPAARAGPPKEPCPKCVEAERKVEIAGIYLAESRLAESRKLLEEAVAADPANDAAKRLLTQVLEEENRRAAAGHERQIAEAEWQLRNGQGDKALELALKLAEGSQDPKIVKRAQQVVARARAGTPGQMGLLVRRVWSGWGLELIVAAGLLLAVSLVLVFVRWAYTAWAGKRIVRIRSIEDKTQLGVAELVAAAFSRLHSERRRAQPASAGLLKLEDLPLPHAGGLLLRLGESDGLTRAIEGLSGKVGTLEVDWVAKFVEALRKWFEAGLPTVTGTAYSSGSGEVTVRLTYRRRDRRISGVSASTKPETGVDAARLSAERAVFRMYYWLDEPDAVEAEVESAAGLREGLALLQRYVDGEPAAVLDEARRKFSDARSAVPGLWEASLYEGIALDLLERHDDALLRFEYVEKNATDPALREKALYNQAVAHMRKYRPRELKRACELFAQVTGSRPDALHEPVKVLAKAGKATAVAHYPIFWEKLLHDRKAVNDQERSAWKRADVGRVFAWLRQVEAIAKEVDRDLAAIRNAAESAWDEKARRQLEWGKWDAAGNVYLNLVTGFLQPPCPDEFDTVKEDRERFLRIALEDFRKSELLLRPGVETLSNIGTAYLYLGRYEDARRYLDDVIKLNPEYEYAVYRKAQSWDRENRPQKVREVLNGHKKSVRIEEFRQLFEKYEVALPE